MDIKELRGKLNLSQQELADKTGIDRAKIAKWEVGKGKPKVEDHNILENFFTMYTGSDVNKVLERVSEKLIQKPDYSLREDEKGLPVYDVEFSAGFIEQIRDGNITPIGFLSIPELKGCDYVVRVTGDSMVPRINERDWIGIKRVVDKTDIDFGRIYGLVTVNYNLIKYIKSTKNPEKWLLVSENKQYEDREFEISRVLELYTIKTILPFSLIKTLI